MLLSDYDISDLLPRNPLKIIALIILQREDLVQCYILEVTSRSRSKEIGELDRKGRKVNEGCVFDVVTNVENGIKLYHYKLWHNEGLYEDPIKNHFWRCLRYIPAEKERLEHLFPQFSSLTVIVLSQGSLKPLATCAPAEWLCIALEKAVRLKSTEPPWLL